MGHLFTKLILSAMLLSTKLIIAQESPQIRKKAQPLLASQYLDSNGADLGREDGYLNHNYRELLKSIKDEDTKKKLQRAEKAWIAFRDANAEFESAFRKDPQGQQLIYSFSQTRTTVNRWIELKHFLECANEQ